MALPKQPVATKMLLSVSDQGECRTADPDLFAATAWTDQTRWVIRSYCVPCPVAAECLQTVVGPLFDGIAAGALWVNGRPIRDRPRR